MYWSNFLHFYQPPNQQKDILERIVNESYRPLMRLFSDNPQAKATININGGLLDLLEEEGYEDVIRDFHELLKRGQIELTGSAKYHAFLPLLPEAEARRQIEINEEALKKHFGDSWQKKGFFPPELAYDFNLARIVKKMGYEWMAAAEIAFGQEKPKLDKIYQVKGLGDFKIFFRHKQASVLLLSGIARSIESFLNELGVADVDLASSPAQVSSHGLSSTHVTSQGPSVETFAVEHRLHQARGYILTIMDAETFGHHRPGLEDLLFEFYLHANQRESTRIGSQWLIPVLVSELPKFFPESLEVEPRASTWSNEEQDFWLDKERKMAAQNPFLLWKDPNNPIHRLQWEFTEWTINLVQGYGLERLSSQVSSHGLSSTHVTSQSPSVETFASSRSCAVARSLLDKALASDMYWWASAKPWWSLEMIEAGAYELKKVVEAIPGVFEEEKNKAEDYYQRILDLAFEWQRSGKIRQAHKELQGEWKDIPFKERAPAEWYNQIILEFEDEMKKAAEKQEFEKAIKWRDAIIKLKKGTDIYDVLHVVDELHSVRKIPSVKPFLQHNKEEFSNFAKKHFLPLDKQEG